MKKIAMTMCILAMATCGFAQKKNVSAAEGKLYEPTDYNGAKNLIEAAMQDPTTSNQAKTYWIASQVYTKLYEEQDVKMNGQLDYDVNLMTESLIKAVDACNKVAELDVLPNEKGQVKPKYTKQLPSKVDKLSKSLFNAGAVNYQKENYKQAVELWNKYIDMADYPMAQSLNMKKDTLFNLTKYYTIDALAKLNNDNIDATSIKYMNDLKEDPKYSKTMYEWLYSTYSKKGDSDKAVNTLKEAIKKFPEDNSYFIGSLINYYVEQKRDNEALAYADEAIASNPKDAQYYLIKAQVYLQKENFDKAIGVAKEAIAVQPENFNANYYCGYSYIRKAEAAMDAANKIKDNNKYKAAKNMANEQFKNSIQFLEKARAIDPTDESNLQLLKSAYYRIGNGDKYSEIDAEIKNLHK